MSLFDEFDKLSSNVQRRRQSPSSSLPKPKSNRSVASARSVASKTSTTPLPPMIASQGSTNTSLNQTEYSPTRPVGSFRFSLSRGGVAASIAGTLVAAASLFVGGYVTAYVVYNPKGPVDVEIGKVKPSSGFEKNYSIDQSGEPGRLKATHRPLEVVMSPETSGGKAVVAPELREGEIRGSVGRTSSYAESYGEKDTNHLSNSEKLQNELDGEVISKIPGNRRKSVEYVAPQRKLERLLTAPSSDDSVSDYVLQSAFPKKQNANRTSEDNGKKPASDVKEAGANRAVPFNQQEIAPKSAYSSNFGYSLQLAAFSSKLNASQMMKKLEGFVPTARIDKGRGQSGQVLYFVRVGYVEKRAEAIIMANRLSAEKKINSGYVMRVKAPEIVR